MKPSLRFLGLAIIGWAGIRTAALGSLPGAELFRIKRSEAKAPPLAPTQFPALQPAEPTTAEAPSEQRLMLPAAPLVRYIQSVIGVPVSLRPSVPATYRPPPPGPTDADLPAPRRSLLASAYAASDRSDYSQLPPLGESPLSRIAGLVGPMSRPAQPPFVDARGIDRLQLSSWALLRSQQAGIAGSRSLASGGQLGASQAGARLIYNYNRQLAIAARLSSEVGRRGGEVAAGIRVHPLVSVPVWVTAERRQAIGSYGGGRNAFALFAEGGLYDRALPLEFALNSYVQAGVVGLNSRDWFVDGGLAISRPVFRNISAGVGLWGAAQKDLARLEAGPRVTVNVRRNLKVHLDWRQKIAGNARPDSGPAVTLSGDF